MFVTFLQTELHITAKLQHQSLGVAPLKKMLDFFSKVMKLICLDGSCRVSQNPCTKYPKVDSNSCMPYWKLTPGLFVWFIWKIILGEVNNNNNYWSCILWAQCSQKSFDTFTPEQIEVCWMPTDTWRYTYRNHWTLLMMLNYNHLYSSVLSNVLNQELLFICLDQNNPHLQLELILQQ